MRKRAAAQEQTRERIVAATVELHQQVGPAATTISDIAARAGVQRQTVYRHFADESQLLAACSARWTSEHPPPDPAAWAQADAPLERLERALTDLYGMYRSTESMTGHVLRDAPRMPVLAPLIRPLQDYLDGVRQLLVEPFGATGDRRHELETLIGLAVSFPAWQQLARVQSLDDAQAARFMTGLAAALCRDAR